MEQTIQQQPPVFNQPQQQPNYGMGRPTLGFGEAVKTCLRKFATFKGRARRSEYWWFALFGAIVSFVFSFVGLLAPIVSYIGVGVSLCLLIPSWAVQTRRLHDTNHSGWWVVIYAILYLIAMVIMGMLMAPVGEQLVVNPDMSDETTIRQFTDVIQANQGLATTMMVCILVAFLIQLVMFVFCVMDSKREPNKYGVSPKYGA